MALGHFISQLDEESHNQILPGWTKRRESRGTKRKAADTPTASDEHKAEDLDDGLAKIQEEALAYLNKRQRARARRKRKIKPTVEPAVVRGAIKALREGHVWNCENNIEDLWAGDNPILISDDFKRSSPMRRLGMLHADAISSVHSNECKRRITALLIHDGHKQAASIVEDSNELPAAELAQLIGLPAVSAKNAISTARGWLRFIGAWGLGGLVLPGPGHREV